jgi:hypothetical protein
MLYADYLARSQQSPEKYMPIRFLVCPRNNSKPINGFSRNLVLETFPEICRQISKLGSYEAIYISRSQRESKGT